MAMWHDDDVFWEAWVPAMFGDRVWRAAVREVQSLIDLTRADPSMKILDLPCGPGRHSLELARRGFTVTGVDRTAALLEHGKRQATVERLTVEWVQDDMRRFRREDSFDLALNLYTSFGYFVDPEDDRKVAENLLASLVPGGMLVLDLMGKEVLARIFQAHDWRQFEDGTIWIEERAVRNGWDWIDLRWILVRETEHREQRLGHRLYSATELTRLLESVGFETPEVFGSLNGAPYDDQAKRLVVVARRP